MKAKQILADLKRRGWAIERSSGSHKVLKRLSDGRTFSFAFGNSDDIGKPMRAILSKQMDERI